MSATQRSRARSHHRRQGRRRPRRRLPGPAARGQEGDGQASPVGDVIEIWSSDPATKTDIGAWAGKVGHEFLGVLEADGYDRVFIRRGK